MPQKRPSNIWPHPTYRYAYVREYRGMACTVIHGGPPLSTGYQWKPGSRTGAMAILEDRLRTYQLGGLAQAPRPANIRSCGDLWIEFIRVRFPKLSKNKQDEYTRYFSRVPQNLPCTETHLIREAVRASIEESHYVQNSKNKVYQRLRTIFKFGIDEGWLTVNPIHRDMIPNYVHALPTPYTEEEIKKILTMKDTSKYKPFVLFLIGSACRPIEALRLDWSHVYEEHCVVHSYKNGQRSARYRTIPYKLCPEVVTALDMARERSTEGSVFGMNNYAKVSEAIDELLGGNGRGLYDIRKYTINKWKRQGMPEVVRHALAGHDESIADVHYETDYSASELVSIALGSTRKNRGKLKTPAL